MFNLVVLEGRLTATPERKTTPSGVSVTSFSIAVDRPYQKDKEKETDFITIVAWRQTAEFICKYFTKGNRIGIEGTIQTRRFQDKNGNNRTSFEVVANNVHFIDLVKKEQDPLIEVEEKLNGFSSANDSDFTEIGKDVDLPF